jgi:hypothetical protein
LGSDSKAINKLIQERKFVLLDDDMYEIFSQEAVNGKTGRGEIARKGDWIKVDGNGYPYPNEKAYFEADHRHLAGDRYEQIPRILWAWNIECEMCEAIIFLKDEGRLTINPDSYEHYYTAQLWGTLEAAKKGRGYNFL